MFVNINLVPTSIFINRRTLGPSSGDVTLLFVDSYALPPWPGLLSAASLGLWAQNHQCGPVCQPSCPLSSSLGHWSNSLLDHLSEFILVRVRINQSPDAAFH